MIHETKVFKIVETISYFIAAWAMFVLVNGLVSSYASGFKNIAAQWPYFLSLVNGIYLLFALHLSAHPLNEKKRHLTFLVNGAILTLTSFVAIMVIGINENVGVYSSFILDGMSPLYPLDGYLLGFLTLFGGASMYFYEHQWAKKPKTAVFATFEGGKAKKVAASIFRSVFVLIALYFMGAFFVVPATFDPSFEHFSGMLGFYLMMVFPTLMLGFYEWGYKDVQDMGKKQKRLYRFSIVFLLLSLMLTGYFALLSHLDPQFLIQGGTALLPIDFMKNILLGPILLTVSSLSAPLIAFFYYLKGNLKANEA
jgi:hypothetical protein